MIINQLKKHKNFLIFLFIFSFFIRFFVFHFYLGKKNNYWQVDSNTYHKIAKSISSGQGYSVNGNLNFYRLPGYPFLLSLYYKYFGINIKNVLWIQIFFASFIPILIFILGFILSLGSLWIAMLSALYSAIHLGLILYAGFFMTESLFIFFFLIFFILFIKDYNLFFCKYKFVETENSDPKNKIVVLFVAGIFLGIASLVRPVGHYLVVLSIFFLLFSNDSFKLMIKNICSLFIGWGLVVFPWILRNYLLLGQFFFHTLPGGHFLYFSASRNFMYEQNCSYDKAKTLLRKKVNKLVLKEQNKLNRNLNEIEICNLRLGIAIKYFKKYPILTLKHWFMDILRTSLSLYSAEILYLEKGRRAIDYFSNKRRIWSLFTRYLDPPTQNMWLRLLVYTEIFLFFLILVGTFLGFVFSIFYFFKYGNKNGICLYFKVLPFIFIFLIIGLAGGYSRMRLPAEPLLIILALSFYFYVFNFKKIKKRSGFV